MLVVQLLICSCYPPGAVSTGLLSGWWEFCSLQKESNILMLLCLQYLKSPQWTLWAMCYAVTHSPIRIDGLGVMFRMQFLGRVRSQAWLRIMCLGPIGRVVDCCWVALHAEGKKGKCQVQNVHGYVGLGIFFLFWKCSRDDLGRYSETQITRK